MIDASADFYFHQKRCFPVKTLPDLSVFSSQAFQILLRLYMDSSNSHCPVPRSDFVGKLATSKFCCSATATLGNYKAEIGVNRSNGSRKTRIPSSYLPVTLMVDSDLLPHCPLPSYCDLMPSDWNAILFFCTQKSMHYNSRPRLLVLPTCWSWRIWSMLLPLHFCTVSVVEIAVWHKIWRIGTFWEFQ